MTPLRIILVVVGALLVLLALLAGWTRGPSARTRPAIAARGAAAGAGVALALWALLLPLRLPQHPAHEPTAPAARMAAPSAVDVVQRASSELSACPAFTAPPVPDGTTASLEQMSAARTAFQAYDAATNAYVACVDSTVDRVARQFAGTATEADIQALKSFGVRAHNEPVDQEQAIADQLNAQLRAYKARHSKP
jgi:hypothetical protein